MTPLHGAVANTRRPGSAIVVGNHLYFQMSSAAVHQLLHENGCVAERLVSFIARAHQGLAQLVCRVHPANAMPPSTSGGLDEKGIAQTLTVANRLLQSLNRAAAPRSDGYLRLLGQTFRGNLVAQAAHHLRSRSDVGNVHLLAKR